MKICCAETYFTRIQLVVFMLKQPIGAILKMQVCKQVDLESDVASSLLSQECQCSERLKK